MLDINGLSRLVTILIVPIEVTTQRKKAKQADDQKPSVGPGQLRFTDGRHESKSHARLGLFCQKLTLILTSNP